MKPRHPQEVYDSSKVIRNWLKIISKQYISVLSNYPKRSDLIEDIKMCQIMNNENPAKDEEIGQLVYYAFKKIVSVPY